MEFKYEAKYEDVQTILMGRNTKVDSFDCLIISICSVLGTIWGVALIRAASRKDWSSEMSLFTSFSCVMVSTRIFASSHFSVLVIR